MKQVMKRGFTLIELLVVIAIIGILAAVVLGSLNDARDNANNASAQTSLNNIRSAAEIIYSEDGFSYDTVCGATRVTDLITAAETQTGTTANCDDDATAFAVEVGLRNSTDLFCVDSTGFSGTLSATKGAATLTCN